MNDYKVTKKTAAEAELTVTVSAIELGRIKTEVLEKMRVGLKIAGFRPGKVPANIAERHVDPSQLQTEVIERAVAQSYTTAVMTEKLNTLTSPKIEIRKFVPFTELEYKAEVALMPDIKFDYKKLRVKAKLDEFDDKELDKAVDMLRRQTAERKSSKKPIENGDEVKLDYEGFLKDKAFEGGSAKNQTLTIGSGQFIPGFEEALVGTKAGENKDFEVSFPKDYQAAELAGKKVTFKTKIHEVTKIVLPDANDTWAKTLGPFKNLDELKNDARTRLEQEHSQTQAKNYENAVLDEALKQAQFEVPQTLVDDQKLRLEHETEDNLRQSGLDIEKYLEIAKKSRADFDKELLQEATRRVKMALIVRYIVEAEQLTVQEHEIELNLGALQAQYASDPKMREELTHDHFREELANHLLSQKAIDRLVTYAKGEGK